MRKPPALLYIHCTLPLNTIALKRTDRFLPFLRAIHQNGSCICEYTLSENRSVTQMTAGYHISIPDVYEWLVMQLPASCFTRSVSFTTCAQRHKYVVKVLTAWTHHSPSPIICIMHFSWRVEDFKRYSFSLF